MRPHSIIQNTGSKKTSIKEKQSSAQESAMTMCLQVQAVLRSKHDPSMVCPCSPQVTNRARNMEGVHHKEHDSTCMQSVWDATNMDIHHYKVPNARWAAENTQPCVLIQSYKTQGQKKSSRKEEQSSAQESAMTMCLQVQAVLRSKHDPSMVCPCSPQATNRARNMEGVHHKEHDST